MKGFKKVLAVLLTIAMVGAMVMGCSSKSDDSSKKEEKKEDKKTEDTKEEEALQAEALTSSILLHHLYPTRHSRQRPTQLLLRQRNLDMK